MGILQVLRLEFWKVRIWEFLNVHPCLSVTPHINCIVARWPDKRWLFHGLCLYQVMMMFPFLNDSPMALNRRKNL